MDMGVVDAFAFPGPRPGMGETTRMGSGMGATMENTIHKSNQIDGGTHELRIVGGLGARSVTVPFVGSFETNREAQHSPIFFLFSLMTSAHVHLQAI